MRTRSARTGASAHSSGAPPVLLDVLTTDLLDLALSFCTEDALRAAYASCRAFRAAAVPHLRRLLSIALVNPQNKQAHALGVFVKRTALVNGFASYTKTGAQIAMLWHANGAWYVGPTAGLGQRRGWMKLVDDCLRPEASSRTWQVKEGNAFVNAPELRCLTGDALAAEMAKAAPQIALVGPTPHRQAVLGVFVKRDELVNGHPSYVKTDHDKIMLWRAHGFWLIGRATELGRARGWVSLLDGCLWPEASSQTWEVADERCKTFVDAPELHCLAGDALAAEMAKAAPQIALVGPWANRLGVFLKRDELVNGYLSYTKAGDNGVMLWHAGGSWLLGASTHLGQAYGWVKVDDSCLRPEASTVAWRIYKGKGTGWSVFPELRCLAVRPSTSRRIWDPDTGRWLDAGRLMVFDV